ncbi:MAG: AhpC/TSA family protein [Bacteroides sp.]|nr:AhpC/TSA family protein [Bacteroides sp.]
MKNIYLIYFLLIVLSACGGKKSDTVTLSGEIKGLGNDTLYIYGADKMYDRMDTLPVKDDKFTATLSLDTLVATWLLFSDGTRYPLFMNKGNKIHIKGSAAEPDILEITGNTFNEELTDFQRELKGLGKPSEKVLEEKAGNFINAHHSSLVSIYLLDKYFVQKPQPDYAQIKELTEQMMGELKDRPYIDELLDRIQEEEKVAVGKSTPFFRMANAKGKQINRADFKDQYLLIHFWASWDTVSRDSNAIYRRIYKKEEKNKKFALLGVSFDIDKEKWQQATKADTLKCEQVCDFSGWNAEITKLFAIRALPANILLSPAGRIEGRNMSSDAIEKKLKQIEEEEEAKEKAKKKTAKR